MTTRVLISTIFLLTACSSTAPPSGSSGEGGAPSTTASASSSSSASSGGSGGAGGGSPACDDTLSNVPFPLSTLPEEGAQGDGFFAVPAGSAEQDDSFVRVVFGPFCTEQAITTVRFGVATDPLFVVADPWTITAGPIAPILNPSAIACASGALPQPIQYGASVPPGGSLAVGLQELVATVPEVVTPSGGWLLVCLRNEAGMGQDTAILNWKGAPSTPRDAWEDPDGTLHAMTDYNVKALDHPWVVTVE